jgi:hypothetical protein
VEITHSGNTDSEKLRMARRHIFSATTRRRSADWDECDRIANDDKRVAMVLRPNHVYGPALARTQAAPLQGLRDLARRVRALGVSLRLVAVGCRIPAHSLQSLR